MGTACLVLAPKLDPAIFVGLPNLLTIPTMLLDAGDSRTLSHSTPRVDLLGLGVILTVP